MLNKKGDVGDFIPFIIMLFVVAVSFYAGWILWDNIKPQLIANEVISGADSFNVTEELDSIDRSINILDAGFLIFFIGFYFVLLISVFYLDTHPGFLIFAIMLFGVIIFVGMTISDVFMTAAGSDELSAASSTFPMTYHIMHYLPIYLVAMGFIFFLVLYASRTGGGASY